MYIVLFFPAPQEDAALPEGDLVHVLPEDEDTADPALVHHVEYLYHQIKHYYH